jgi:hypothetical protein
MFYPAEAQLAEPEKIVLASSNDGNADRNRATQIEREGGS